MARPQFWLQVRKDYIFDNFDKLTGYLRQYTYNPDEDNPDYDSTLTCMRELSDDIGAEIKATPFYKTADTCGYSVEQTARLFMATILASNKAGITPVSVILSLAELITKVNADLNEDVLRGVYNVVINCIRERELVSAGFTWDDINAPVFNVRLLAIKFARMSFRNVTSASVCHYIENHGLLMIPSEGEVELSPVNRDRFDSMSHREKFVLPGLLTVVVPPDEHTKNADFERMYNMTTVCWRPST